jgi:hypothetical protein
LLNDQNIYDARKSKFTEQDYIKMMNNPKIKENVHFQDVMDSLKGDANQKKKAFIDIMNTVAMQNEGNLEPIADSGIKVQDGRYIIADPGVKATIRPTTVVKKPSTPQYQQFGPNYNTSTTTNPYPAGSAASIAFSNAQAFKNSIEQQRGKGKSWDQSGLLPGEKAPVKPKPTTTPTNVYKPPVSKYPSITQIEQKFPRTKSTTSQVDASGVYKPTASTIQGVEKSKEKDPLGLVAAANEAEWKRGLSIPERIMYEAADFAGENPLTSALIGGAAIFALPEIAAASEAIALPAELAELAELGNTVYKGYQTIDKGYNAVKNVTEGNYAGAAGNLIDLGKSFIPAGKLSNAQSFALDATSGGLSGYGDTGSLEGAARGSFDNSVVDIVAQKAVGNKDTFGRNVAKEQLKQAEQSVNPSKFNNGGYVIARDGIINRLRRKVYTEPDSLPVSTSQTVYTYPTVDITRGKDVIEGGYKYSGCVQGGCEGLAEEHNLNTTDMRKMSNMYGSAWQIGNNMFATPVDVQHLQKDDVVVFSRPSNLKDILKGIPSSNQHFGYVDSIESDGTPLIRHYVGDRYYTERLPDVGKAINTKYTFSSAYTPDEFRPVEYSKKTLNLDSGYSPNQIERGVIEAANKDHEDYQNILNLTDKEFDQINKLAFGIIGAESNFGRSKKTLYRMATPKGLQKTIKAISHDFGYGSGYDPNLNSLSAGYSSTKESGQFNFSPIDQEAFDKKHKLDKITDPVEKAKRRREIMNKEIGEGKFSDYDKNTNYIYQAFNQLGVDPKELDNPENSYKATLATLAFYKQLNPNATDEDLMKRYTGKRNVKKYSEEVRRHLNKIDGFNDNNPENSFLDDLYGNLSIGSNKVYSALDHIKQVGVGVLRNVLPGPANIKAVAADAIGTKYPITEQIFSDSNLNKLEDVVLRSLANNRGYIEYDDFKTSGNKNEDVGGGSSPGFKKALTDDAYILKTTLGQARIKDLGNGYFEITDTYDFNDAGKGFSFADDIKKRGTSGYNLARSIGRNFGSRDGLGAPVNIKLYIPDFYQRLDNMKKTVNEENRQKELKNQDSKWLDESTKNIEKNARGNMIKTLSKTRDKSSNNKPVVTPDVPRVVRTQPAPVVNTPPTPVVRTQPQPVTPPQPRIESPTPNTESPFIVREVKPNGMGLIDTMTALGYRNTSKEFRKKLAYIYGVKNYDFSAEKNTELRNILLSESIKKNQSNPPEELQDFNFYEYGGFINNDFAVGGPVYPPAYTTDPRKVQAYQDSLNLFNKANAIRQVNNNRVRAAINNNNANNSFWQSDLDAPISRINPFAHSMGRSFSTFPSSLYHDEIEPTRIESYYSPDIDYDTEDENEFDQKSKYGVDNYLFDRPKQPYILDKKTKQVKKSTPKPKAKVSKPNSNIPPQAREPMELEPIPTKQVLPLTSNFTMEPRSFDAPFIPQYSNEEYNREYSIRIPTIDINKRQVAPRTNRVFGNNVVNPRNQYQRSIEFGSREIPIINEYQLNNLRMKLGMEPEGFKQNGGKNTKTITLSTGKVVTLK